MSTQTTQASTGFAGAGVSKVPDLICTGYVSEIREAKEGKGLRDYFYIVIEGTNGSRKSGLNFFFRPQWFTPGFNPESEKTLGTETDPDAGEKLLKNYRETIMGKVAPLEEKQSISILEGLCGSTEAFNRFVALRDAAYAAKGGTGDFTKDEVRDLFNRFFLTENHGATIGYILRQRSNFNEVTGEWELDEGYEIRRFWAVTEENIQRQVKFVRNRAGEVKLGFEV